MLGKILHNPLIMKSRGGQIRTDDFLLPKQALYQAELRPVCDRHEREESGCSQYPLRHSIRVCGRTMVGSWQRIKQIHVGLQEIRGLPARDAFPRRPAEGAQFFHPLRLIYSSWPQHGAQEWCGT